MMDIIHQRALLNVQSQASRRGDGWVFTDLLQLPTAPDYKLSKRNSGEMITEHKEELKRKHRRSQEIAYREVAFSLYKKEALVDIIRPLYKILLSRLEGKSEKQIVSITEKFLKEFDLENFSKKPLEGENIRDIFQVLSTQLESRLKFRKRHKKKLDITDSRSLIDPWQLSGIYNLRSQLTADKNTVGSLVSIEYYQSLLGRILPSFFNKLNNKLGNDALSKRMNRVIHDVIIRAHMENQKQNSKDAEYLEAGRDPIYTRIVADIINYIGSCNTRLTSTTKSAYIK